MHMYTYVCTYIHIYIHTYVYVHIYNILCDSSCSSSTYHSVLQVPLRPSPPLTHGPPPLCSGLPSSWEERRLPAAAGLSPPSSSCTSLLLPPVLTQVPSPCLEAIAGHWSGLCIQMHTHRERERERDRGCDATNEATEITGDQLIHSISGCLSHECKTGNQTDQSKSPTSSGTAILIGQFDFPFYIHGTSNLKSTVHETVLHVRGPQIAHTHIVYMHIILCSWRTPIWCSWSETQHQQWSIQYTWHYCVPCINFYCPVTSQEASLYPGKVTFATDSY